MSDTEIIEKQIPLRDGAFSSESTPVVLESEIPVIPDQNAGVQDLAEGIAVEDFLPGSNVMQDQIGDDNSETDVVEEPGHVDISVPFDTKLVGDPHGESWSLVNSSLSF
jgi:hypothetical protein